MSRCSVKMTSFWCGDGVGGGTRAPRRAGSVPSRSPGDGIAREDLTEQAGQLAPLGVRAAAPDGRASASRPFRVSISIFSSAMVAAAVAWSRISSSAASTSLSGASSRSSTSSASSAGPAGADGPCDLAAALEHLQLAQPALQPLAAAAQRLVDRLGRGGEAPLQDGQREADRARRACRSRSASARLNSSRT